MKRRSYRHLVGRFGYMGTKKFAKKYMHRLQRIENKKLVREN